MPANVVPVDLSGEIHDHRKNDKQPNAAEQKRIIFKLNEDEYIAV